MGIKVVLFDLDGTLLPMDQDVFVKDYFGRIAAKLVPQGYDPKKLVDTIKTDATGYAISGKLMPGKYYVVEVHDRDETYWEYDANVEQQVTITAGSRAEVSYTNTQYGRIQFTKTTNTGNQLGGWVFRVTDSNYEVVGEYTTDETGNNTNEYTHIQSG